MTLVILDRDGVINEDSDTYVKSPSEWHPIEGSLEAIVRLKNAGIPVYVASNQSGIGRGLFDYGDLFAIHDKLARMLADLGTQLDGIFFCPHAPKAGCRCRKPEPGLLEDIMLRAGRPASECLFIGNSVSDVKAARAAGIRPLLIGPAHSDRGDAPRPADVPRYDRLAVAADTILGNNRPNSAR